MSSICFFSHTVYFDTEYGSSRQVDRTAYILSPLAIYIFLFANYAKFQISDIILTMKWKKHHWRQQKLQHVKCGQSLKGRWRYD